jgi:FlaA1/EpsC-like NDP-sugar epimerase
MYKRDSQDWVKHWDFMVIDLIALQIAFVISYILQTGSVNPYQVPEYRNTAMIVVLLHVCAEFLMEGYSSVLIRGYWKEFIAVFQQACVVFACFLVYLFIVKDTWVLSRTFMLLYFAMAVCFLYCGRVLLKVWLKSHKGITTGKRTILLVGNRDNYRELIDAFLKNPYSEFRVVGALVKDLQDEEQQKADTAAAAYRGIPLFSDEEKTLAFILANWVDEVMIQMPRDYLVAEGTEFINICSRMGVIIHLDLSKVIGDMRYQVVEKIEDYHVLSKSMCMVTTRQLIAKRALDILGGITGCLITGILFLVIGPVIYIKSPALFYSGRREWAETEKNSVSTNSVACIWMRKNEKKSF